MRNKDTQRAWLEYAQTAEQAIAFCLPTALILEKFPDITREDLLKGSRAALEHGWGSDRNELERLVNEFVEDRVIDLNKAGVKLKKDS